MIKIRVKGRGAAFSMADKVVNIYGLEKDKISLLQSYGEILIQAVVLLTYTAVTVPSRPMGDCERGWGNW